VCVARAVVKETRVRFVICFSSQEVERGRKRERDREVERVRAALLMRGR
jgi:hypothetical protein